MAYSLVCVYEVNTRLPKHKSSENTTALVFNAHDESTITKNMQDMLQTFKISDSKIGRDSKISQSFLAAYMRFQQVVGPST